MWFFKKKEEIKMVTVFCDRCSEEKKISEFQAVFPTAIIFKDWDYIRIFGNHNCKDGNLGSFLSKKK